MKRSVLVIACLLASSFAFAQQSVPADREARGKAMHEKAKARFAASDSNQDGKLNLAEWQQTRIAQLSEAFAKIDVDKDGFLTAEEMRQAHGMRRAMRGQHRGKAMQEKLRLMDSDGDQALSRSEIGDKLPRLSTNFDQLDSNHDGKLTREEMRAGREAMRKQSK